MKRAALGVRKHSGWGVLVAVSGDLPSVEVIDRRRIVTSDPKIPGANQPYHYAASLGLTKVGLTELELAESQRYLANCAAACKGLALAAVAEVARELEKRHYRIVGSAVLLASGRPL